MPGEFFSWSVSDLYTACSSGVLGVSSGGGFVRKFEGDAVPRCGAPFRSTHAELSWVATPVSFRELAGEKHRGSDDAYRLRLFPPPLLERNSHQRGRLGHQLGHRRKTVEPCGGRTLVMHALYGRGDVCFVESLVTWPWSQN